MRILGIDPGKTTGWCIYDSEAERVVSSGQFPDSGVAWQGDITRCDEIVIERPRVVHGSAPPVGDTCIDAGILWHKLLTLHRKAPHWLTMTEIRKRLTAATHGAVNARNDATVRAALVVVHGYDSDRRPKIRKKQVVEAGGTIYVRNAHERDALAAAWAFAYGTVGPPCN